MTTSNHQGPGVAVPASADVTSFEKAVNSGPVANFAANGAPITNTSNQNG